MIWSSNNKFECQSMVFRKIPYTLSHLICNIKIILTCHFTAIIFFVVARVWSWLKDNKMSNTIVASCIIVCFSRRLLVCQLYTTYVISHVVATLNSLPLVENIMIAEICKYLRIWWCNVGNTIRGVFTTWVWKAAMSHTSVNLKINDNMHNRHSIKFM